MFKTPIEIAATFYGLWSDDRMSDTVAQVREAINPALSILGVVPSLYDKRKTLHRDALKAIRQAFPKQVFDPIRDNVSLAEAPSHGQDIFSYAPDSNGAIDYGILSKSVLASIN